VHTIATLLVFADLEGNAGHVKNTIMAFSMAIVIGFIALAIAKSDHRGAWMAIPLVIVLLVLASQGGTTALRNGGMQVVHLIFGG
jgi:heme/copper-type cytochrome/quinol oxidase subunit 4